MFCGVFNMFLLTVVCCCFEGRCRENHQQLRQQIIVEQQRLLGKVAAQHKGDRKEHGSSTFIADDDSLLVSEGDTGSIFLLTYTAYNSCVTVTLLSL